MAYLMRRDGVNDSAASLDRIDAAGQHLLDIIHDVLSLSQIEAGRMNLEAPLDLAALCRGVLEVMATRRSARARLCATNSVICRPPAWRCRAPAPVAAQLPGQCGRSTESGSINLRCHEVSRSEAGHLIRFEVIDSGPGLSAEAQAQLFQPFHQVDNLSTWRMAAPAWAGHHPAAGPPDGGDAGCDSTPGAAVASGSPPSERRVKGIARRCRQYDDSTNCWYHTLLGATCLPAEDTVNREVIVALLEDRLLVVDVVEDGAAAVERVGERDYDLLLMDVPCRRWTDGRPPHPRHATGTLPIIAC